MIWWCLEPGSNRYAPYAGKRRILSPLCLPISPSRHAAPTLSCKNRGDSRCRTEPANKRLSPARPMHRAMNGAGEESRTLDLNLGKVALYQLSYSRMESGGAGRSRTDLHGFAIRCITALLPRQKFLPRPARAGHSLNKKGKLLLPFSEFGAGKESRTLDLNLGKVALYQLSYSRVIKTQIIAVFFCFCKSHAKKI